MQRENDDYAFNIGIHRYDLNFMSGIDLYQVSKINFAEICPSFPEKIKDTITMFSITVILKPIFTVKLEDRTKIAEGVDVDKFLSELTKELICIKKLLPFV